MARLKVTKKAVKAVSPADKDVILWDAVKGFGCKITPAGRRVYFLYYLEPGPACSVVRQLAPTVR